MTDIKTASMTELLANASQYKPKTLIISDIHWKYLIRSVWKGKNILIVGPTGCGKTVAAQEVSKVVRDEQHYFYFNLGAMQDARTSLIGNTHYNKQLGTYFHESTFIKAIRTENAVVLLDEISRGHHDAWNILFTALDPIQRYIRLDEKIDSEVVKVADGVTFIATANVGNEYTATRVLDRALMDRFPVKIEMKPLDKESEAKLLRERYNITDEAQIKTLDNLTDIAEHTRIQVKAEDGKLTNFLSTRAVAEMAELIVDNFSLVEIAECAIYPNFDAEGGNESERTYVKQLVQKHIPEDEAAKIESEEEEGDEGKPPF